MTAKRKTGPRTAEAKARLYSVQRSAALREQMERKVSLVEAWAVRGIPEDILRAAWVPASEEEITRAKLSKRKPQGRWDDATVPLNARAFRAWRGPGGDLAMWSAAPERRHPDLARRRDAALARIKRLLRPPGTADRLFELEALNRALNAANAALSLQNAQLLSEIDGLIDDLRETQQAKPR
ncbi:hypothetical protein [Azospirillum brasilense]|uniref:hypothetical protein n=1 Tax=Azospirillum brasilense TaxID=192 RepID=UPI000E68E632|nr:hypothetical protein [Azospirillum brasilense]NUB27073.1 hypothetical protein [Azospirillum brasilense]NUB34835.1 hypothetical protein [Azospirillum brasilense]RIW07341.1 hypothetical protein D2T81_04025 [Azospirillum brasilense]